MTAKFTSRPPSSTMARPADQGQAQATYLISILAFLVIFCALLIPLMFGGGSSCDAAAAGQPDATQEAANGIPADYLDLYRKAGAEYGIPWTVLAGVGKVETDHGRSTLPGVHAGENFAGAGGPMQFLQPTWDAFGVDGDKDGKKNRYDPADAIPGAARYLKHNGAPARLRNALWHYNHSWDYVDLVLSWAKRYGSGDLQIAPVQQAAACLPGAVPDGIVGKIIAFAMAQRGKPYVFGATGPDAWDCSSLVQGAYRSVGITAVPRTTFQQWPFGVKIPKGTEQPGDLVFFNSGPGTSAGNPGHVGMVIDPKTGDMIVARCSTCDPAIGVQNYKTRSDWIGSTRPLAHPDVQRQLKSLDSR